MKARVRGQRRLREVDEAGYESQTQGADGAPFQYWACRRGESGAHEQGRLRTHSNGPRRDRKVVHIEQQNHSTYDGGAAKQRGQGCSNFGTWLSSPCQSRIYIVKGGNDALKGADGAYLAHRF